MGIYFSNKDWDALFTKEQTNADAKVREAAFAEVQDKWAVDVPTAPIWQGDLYVFTKKNVTGVKIGPTLIFNCIVKKTGDSFILIASILDYKRGYVE